MNLTLKLLFERSLVRKTNVQLSDVDYIIMGTVIQEVKTANIAREVIVQIGSFIQDSRKDYLKKNKVDSKERNFKNTKNVFGNRNFLCNKLFFYLNYSNHII